MKFIRNMRILVGAIQRVGAPRLMARGKLRLRHHRLLRTGGQGLPLKRLSPSKEWKTTIGKTDFLFRSPSEKGNTVELCGERFFANEKWLSVGQPAQMEYSRDLPRMELFYHEWLLHPDYGQVNAEAFLQQYLLNHRERLNDWSHEWHPYSVSNRLISWVSLLLSGKISDPLQSQLIQEIGWQADYVEHFLEEDIGANHLLKNKFSLAVVDHLLFHDFRSTSVASYVDEAVTQHLEDGGHYERCPMYHAKVLADMLFFQALLGESIPKLNELVGKSRRWLEAMTLADGNWSNFGDSWFIPKLKNRLELFSKSKSEANTGIVYLKESGYVRLSSGPNDWSAIMDVGGFGPDFNPGHGHADALSIQVSMGDWLLVPDPGVLHYSPNDQRAFLKNSQAHNGPSLANRDYAEMTAGFRVGKAASVDHVEVGESFIEGAHTGFGNILTKRRVKYSESGLDVTDSWIPKGNINQSDTAWLRWLIDAPFDSIREQCFQEDGLSLILAGTSGQLLSVLINISSRSNAAFRVSASWFSPSFGQKTDCTEICVSVPGLHEIKNPLQICTTFRILNVN